MSLLISFAVLSINKLTSSSDLNNLLVNALLNLAHIFSAGFSSGEYGGRKTNLIPHSALEKTH
jgi:hypothetical protein